MNLLMCRPDFYGVEYDINPWMTDNLGKVDAELAMEQWTALYNNLKNYANVNLVQQDPNCPDQVFAANAGYIKDGKAALSNFTYAQRAKEVPFWEKWFLDNGYITVRQSNYFFEGAGDLLYDGWNTHYFGHGFRSTLNVNALLELLCLPYYPLKLVDSRFYHLDTCFMPLDQNTILCYPPAINMEDFVSACHGKHLITVTEEEAKMFACNVVVIGKDVFMPTCYSVAEKLSKAGFNPHLFDMSEFIKAGGACKCLVLEV